MNLTRFFLLLLTLVAISGEAVTLGLGNASSDRDQIHAACDEGEEIRRVKEQLDNLDDQVNEPVVLLARSELRAAQTFAEVNVIELGSEIQGAKPCGRLKRHRWIGVDLN